MKTKICKRCGNELPVSMFYKNNRSADKLPYYCKDCVQKTLKKVKEDAMPLPKKEEHHLCKVYTNKDLAKFEPRDLMLELKARGYEGELLYREVKITEHRINLSKLN